MSEYKTRAEMDVSSEFIQYLERLRSGSLSSGLGVNRPLERLAENADASLSAALSAQTQHLISTADITWSPNTITFGGGLIAVNFVSPAQSARRNFITNPTNLVLPGATGVAYVVLDRATDGATVSFQTAASMADYQTLLESASDRADYFLFAVSDTDLNLRLFSGHVLRSGESLINSSATDTQYAQQTEATLIRNNQKDNLKLFLTNGGDISWDVGTTTLTFGDDLIIEFPADSGNNRVAAGSFVIPAGSALYVTLSRDPSGSVLLSPSVASFSGSVPDNDDTFVIALHKSADNRLYLWDGSALSDGESIKLGGVRIGVQFFYKNAGLGVNSQIYDLTSLVAPSVEYRVGSGELMVYRNGRKATASRAYWEGEYPAGSLNTSGGGLSAQDDYVEEDRNGAGGPLTGNRILWLREDPTPLGGSLTANETATSLFFGAGTFPANLEQTFPQSDDIVEIFIGNQGASPTITIPDGLYGFEVVWTADTATAVTRGGTVVVNGIKYVNNGSSQLEVLLNGTGTPSAIFPSDTLPDDDWAYIYLGPGSVPGGEPDIRISSFAPTNAGGLGVHPSNSDYKFLSSAYVLTGRSAFRSFTKSGGWVYLDGSGARELSASFAGTVTGSFETVDVQAAGGLPATTMGTARLRLVAALDGSVGDGQGVDLEVRQVGALWPGLPAASIGALKPTNAAVVDFEFNVISTKFDVRFDAGDFAGVASVIVIGYSEGRFTAVDGM
jgi:hypothetical protein